MKINYWYLLLLGGGVILFVVIVFFLQRSKLNIFQGPPLLRADAYKTYKKQFGKAPPKGTSAQDRWNAIQTNTPLNSNNRQKTSRGVNPKPDARFDPSAKNLRLKRISATYEPLNSPLNLFRKKKEK